MKSVYLPIAGLTATHPYERGISKLLCKTHPQGYGSLIYLYHMSSLLEHVFLESYA